MSAKAVIEPFHLHFDRPLFEEEKASAGAKET